MRSAALCTAWLVVASLACGDDAGEDGGSGGGSSESAGGDGDGDGDGDGSGSGGGEGETGDASGEGGDGDGDGDGGKVCMPDAMDTPCTACIKVDCCQALQDCQQNQSCACMLDCLDAENPDYLACLGQCELDPNPPAFDDVMACAQGPCADVCMFP